jgi:hypothetical protein
MKKLLFLLGLYMVTSAQLCTSILRTDEFNDPTTGLKVLSQSRVEGISSNAMKKDAVYERTVAFDLKKEFQTRFKVDISKLQSFKFSSVSGTFNKDECKKLSSYYIKITMPDGTVFADSSSVANPCDLAKYGGSTGRIFGQTGQFAFVDIDANHKDAQIRKAVETDYAQAIKDGKTVTVTIRMQAREAIPPGFGAVALAIFEARYRP